jgi:hypothetical protein
MVVRSSKSVELERVMLFDDHYQVFLANGVHSEDLHFAVRYRVYCEERGFRGSAAIPGGS